MHVGAGSRQDTLETTGAAHLLVKMLSRGTTSHSKASFSEEIESMGARLLPTTEREQSSLSLQCMKGDVNRAISLLGDAFSNASLDSAEIELTKQEVAQEHEKNHKDYEGTLLE